MQGKVVYCPCDNPDKSQFIAYFKQNFANIGIKKLIATWFDLDAQNTLYTLEPGADGVLRESRQSIPGIGDFRSPHMDVFFEEADVVITNPPFSIMQDFMAKMTDCNKQYLFIGQMLFIHVQYYFPLFIEGKSRLGWNKVNRFDTPEGEKVVACWWYTNLAVDKVNPPIKLRKSYEINKSEYETFDDAIIDDNMVLNVPKIKDIPAGWRYAMGVPISFAYVWPREQFELLGFARRGAESYIPYDLFESRVNGDLQFTRLVIKFKQEA